MLAVVLNDIGVILRKLPDAIHACLLQIAALLDNA